MLKLPAMYSIDLAIVETLQEITSVYSLHFDSFERLAILREGYESCMTEDFF